MSWSQLHTDVSIPTEEVGVVTMAEPRLRIMPEGMSVHNLPSISAEEELFVQTHGRNGSDNAALLDMALVGPCQGYIVRINMKDVMVGFALSLAHAITIKGCEPILTGLTTHLCVKEEHRSQGIGMFLIETIIRWGFAKEIHTGYHYLRTPKTRSAVAMKPWYRPLNVKACLAAEYQLPTLPSRGFRDTTSLVERTYSLPKTTASPASLEDAAAIISAAQRRITIDPALSWSRLSMPPFIWLKAEGGVACVRKYVIQGVTRILAAQLCFFECLGDATASLRSIFAWLCDHECIVVHGLAMGAQLGTDAKMIMANATLHLDFYNVHIPTCSARQIALMYV